MTRLRRHLPALVIAAIGLAGAGGVLYAWRLPPFQGGEIRTENAYVRGDVASLSPRIAGYVAEIPVDDFEPVTEGEALVCLDDREQRQALARAQAGLAGAEAALKANTQAIRSAQARLEAAQAAAGAARAAVDTADAQNARQARLQAKGYASEATAEDAILSLRQAEAALTAAQSQVDVAREAVASARIGTQALEADRADARAAVEEAKLQLEFTVVRAPADGRLGRVRVRPGQYVSQGATLMSEVSSRVWVIANLRERELADLRPEQPVRVTVDALHDRAFTGRIARLSPATASEFSVLSTAAATGNFTKIAQRLPVRIEIDPGQPEAGRLAPGMSVVMHAERRG